MSDGKSLGTHRFQRAGLGRRTHWRPATRLELQAIITQPKRGDFRVFDSDQYASPRDCALEAMRTQEQFSFFHGVAHCDLNDSFYTRSRAQRMGRSNQPAPVVGGAALTFAGRSGLPIATEPVVSAALTRNSLREIDSGVFI